MNNLKSNLSVCAVIPFFNEEAFIRNVILKTKKYVDQIIAVNDGSTDNSEKMIKDLDGVVVLSSKINRGKGFALAKGFEECVRNNFDIIITLDGDNQHSPELIPEFISAISSNDIVIGNRLGDLKNMPVARVLSNNITSFLLSLKTGQKILDSQCGYRAYKKKVLEIIKTTSAGYEAESEILVLAARLGFRIGFIDIPTIYGGEKSKMNPIEAIKGFIKILFV